MNCFEVKEKVHDYFDDLLSLKDKEEIDVHLGECDFCKKDYERLNKLFEGIKSLSASIKYPEKILTEISIELSSDLSQLPNIPANLLLSQPEVKEVKQKKGLARFLFKKK